MLEGTQTEEATKPVPEGQRVSCPSCGHLLFKIKELKAGEIPASIEIKCKASRCGKFVNVTFIAGKLNLALQ